MIDAAPPLPRRSTRAAPDRGGRPKPARRPSDSALAARARAGDDAAFEALAARYAAYIRARASTFFLPSGGSAQDLAQEGLLGLYQSVRDYRPGRCGFAAFARVCIDRQILTAVKAATREKHRAINTAVPLDAPIRADSALTLADVLPGPDRHNPEHEAIRRLECRELLGSMRALLSPLEYTAAADCLAGLSYREISAQAGLGQKSIDNALQRAKRKLADAGSAASA